MNTRTKKKSLGRVALTMGIIGLLTFGVAAPANAYWYNITRNVGSQSIQVRNTDNHYFYVGAGNSANNINRAFAGWRQCLEVKNLQNGAFWRSCFAQGGSIAVPSHPGGVITIRKYNY
jgi:hypothetical protein